MTAGVGQGNLGWNFLYILFDFMFYFLIFNKIIDIFIFVYVPYNSVILLNIIQNEHKF